MSKATFHNWLKRQGRSEEVADRVIRLVAVFSDFLSSQTEHDLDSADSADLETFILQVETDAQLPGAKRAPSAKSYLWALRYYYQYGDNQPLAGYAAAMRQSRIKRKPFRLQDFRGVEPEDVRKLGAVGIKNTTEMLKAGATEKKRGELAEEAGIPLQRVTELVKLSDLARIPGMKGIRARLYYDAGVDTLSKLASWAPAELHQMLEKFVAETGFEGIAPQPAEVHFSVTRARELPPKAAFE